MPLVLPPPLERFDPITARWVTPGGPLHDPERGDGDTDRGEPVTLVGPIPPELAGLDAQGILADGPSSINGASRRFRWAILAVLAVGMATVVVAGFVVGAM